jgi:hypothetical protein
LLVTESTADVVSMLLGLGSLAARAHSAHARSITGS